MAEFKYEKLDLGSIEAPEPNQLPEESIWIGNREYYLQDLQQPNGTFNGICYPEHGTIFVSRELQPRFHLEVTLHEVLHAIWHNYNMNDQDDEERTVSQMAMGLAQVLVDNPELLRYIKRQSE